METKWNPRKGSLALIGVGTVVRILEVPEPSTGNNVWEQVSFDVVMSEILYVHPEDEGKHYGRFLEAHSSVFRPYGELSETIYS